MHALGVLAFVVGMAALVRFMARDTHIKVKTRMGEDVLLGIPFFPQGLVPFVWTASVMFLP